MYEYNAKENLGKIFNVDIETSSISNLNKNNIPVRIIGTLPDYIGKVIAFYKDELVLVPKDKIMFEPEIKDLLDIPQSEKIICLYEKTCGAVIFTEYANERKYLLIKNESGHIGFPKGHIEINETEEETAIREISEETGFTVKLEKDFRMEYEYVTPSNTNKRCVYFLAHYDYSPARIQESEISESWLVSYDEAMVLLNFIQDKDILMQAEKKLRNAND